MISIFTRKVYSAGRLLITSQTSRTRTYPVPQNSAHHEVSFSEFILFLMEKTTRNFYETEEILSILQKMLQRTRISNKKYEEKKRLLSEILKDCILKLTPFRNQTRVQTFTSPPSPPVGNEAEIQLSRRLAQAFPDATAVQVQDVSGGCGAMFEIAVTSPSFKGLSIVKQHKLVTEALKEEIKDMHGLRIYTSPD